MCMAERKGNDSCLKLIDFFPFWENKSLQIYLLCVCSTRSRNRRSINHSKRISTPNVDLSAQLQSRLYNISNSVCVCGSNTKSVSLFVLFCLINDNQSFVSFYLSVST